ncbi:MAG: hypothetical protein AB7R90_13190 [Reyranellaceae bacterium]
MFRSAPRYIAVQAAVEFFVNAALNGAIGWYWTSGLEHMPLWGWPSAALDLLPTGFGIALLLSLAFTWRFHRRLRAGTTAPAARYPGRVPGFVHRLPLNAWWRCGLIGLAGAVLAVVLLMALQAAGTRTLERWDFILLKTVFAALVATGAMLIAGYRALGDGVTPQRPMGYWTDRPAGKRDLRKSP